MLTDSISLRDEAFWNDVPATSSRPSSRGAGLISGRVESRGRARTLQALYAADVRGFSDVRRIAVQVWDDLRVQPDERLFASRLMETIVSQSEKLDSSLKEVTSNWRLERLGAVERSVLRLGAAELLRGETPPRVVIKEAIHLAERFGSERSAGFVNGVLDALARRLGLL